MHVDAETLNNGYIVCSVTNSPQPSIQIVKLAHIVNSIKQSPVLKGHLFLSCHRKFHFDLTFFDRSHVI
jgi:hypothetical protein